MKFVFDLTFSLAIHDLVEDLVDQAVVGVVQNVYQVGFDHIKEVSVGLFQWVNLDQRLLGLDDVIGVCSSSSRMLGSLVLAEVVDIEILLV